MSTKRIQIVGEIDIPQSDWNQTDETQKDFIKNKPIIGQLVSKDIVDQTDLSAELQAILNMYLLNIDYDALLAFDTNELIINGSTTSVLGQAILGQLVLA